MTLLSSSRRQVAALAILLAPTLLSAQSTGTVSGRVLDTQGAPLQGASISLAGTKRGAIARSDGSYRLTAPAGRYEIRARLFGYTPSADSVTIRAGSDVTEVFRLERAATSSRRSRHRHTRRGANGHRRAGADRRAVGARDPTRRAAPRRRR